MTKDVIIYIYIYIAACVLCVHVALRNTCKVVSCEMKIMLRTAAFLTRFVHLGCFTTNYIHIT